MNILRIARNFPSLRRIKYGIEPTVYYVSREQVQMGLDVHIICKGSPQEKKYEEIDGIKVHRVSSPFDLTMLHRLLRLSKELQIDIIHSHATSGFPYAIKRKIFRNRRSGHCYLVHIHGTTKGILQAWSKTPSNILNKEMIGRRIKICFSIMKENVSWKGADALITNSQFLKKELPNIYAIPKERIHVVYNGVDLQTFCPRNSKNVILKKHGLDPKSLIILYLGGFRPVKGPLYIIKAIEKIHKENKDIKILFVGGKNPLDIRHQEAMMKLTRELRENGSIHMIENIPHVQLPDYYSAADAVVVPSIYDAFPKVILEAMACGTPVVASAVGGIQELISHGKTGILVKPADPEELAEAITAIVSDPELRNKISDDAKKMVKERFTWEHVAENTLAVYEKLLE